MTDTVETAAETLPSGFGCVEEPVLYLTGSGELLDWNPAFAELIGGVDTDSTTATADVLDSEDRRRLQNGVTNALETGRETLTVSIQSKTGAETGLELSLVSVSDEWTTASRVVGIGRVIETPETPGSERLETDGLSDDRRRQERERYETLINQSTDGVMVVRDGRYDFVNERFAELSGYDTEELLGMSFKKVVAPEYHDLVQERYEKRLAGESPPDTYEIEIVRADGRRRTLELSSSPLRESGETTILANVRDVTHRKRREQAISALQDATAQIQTADSPEQIADIAVDAATDILETERAICWLYDAESDTLEPTAVTDAVETQAVDAVGLSRGTDDAGPDDETRFTATDIPEDSQNENGHRLSLGPHGLLDVGDSEHTEPDAVLLELIETLAEHATTALDRVERTQDLRESERRYRAIFNQTYQFTGLMQPDGTLIEVNDTALEFGNLDPDDVLGKKLWNAYWFTHASEMQDRIEAAVELAATGEFIREEIPVRGGERMAVIDFSIRPITDDDGNVELLIPEGRDITELNERKEELKQERDYLRRTEELADVGGWEVDFAERSIRWTIGAKRLYEVDETFEPSFENASDYFHPDDWEAITDAITDCRETGTEFDIEVRMITALGQTRWVRLQGEAVSREDSGTIRGVVADITDRREREQRLMVLNRVLRHNLRNNLGVITAFSDHLESLLTPPERTASGGMYRPGPAAAGDTDSAAGADGEQVAHVPVSEARSYTERITDSANDLLSLAEKARNFEQTIERAERTQPIAVRPILTDLLTEYRETYPETTIEADIDPISLRGNAEFIRRAVGELLSNAVEHSDRETPSITVTAEKQADGQVAITVADDGSGIPEMEQEVLRSGEESSLFHGSGVGLWTVNWLVTRLGGQITITENEPRGTAVVLTLPAADD